MLTIGNISIDSPLVLAPMAGISDLPYRLINREYGCGFAFTEMICARSLVYESSKTLDMLASEDKDRPLGVQLLGGDPDTMKRALDILLPYSFDIIDLNAACPVKKVISKGRGAELLRDPVKLQMLLKVIVDHIDVPVTVKIRSGWDEESVNASEIARRAEDAGVSAIFIHGRTRVQGYSGTVDYRIIKEVKDAVKIPVIASGDGLTPVLIKKMFDETGCDGVAVARGALGNPWIFREACAYLNNETAPARPDVHEVVSIMKEHLKLSVACNGERRGIIRFRKFFPWYTKGMAVKELKTMVFKTGTLDSMMQLINAVKYVMDTGDISNMREIPVKFNQLPG